MDNKLPTINKIYSFSFPGVEYNVKYLENDMLESICTYADLNHHPSRVNQAKIFKISSFPLCENITCYYWSTPRVNMVYIVDWNKMIINAIMTSPDMKQVRESGIVKEF